MSADNFNRVDSTQPSAITTVQYIDETGGDFDAEKNRNMNLATANKFKITNKQQSECCRTNLPVDAVTSTTDQRRNVGGGCEGRGRFGILTKAHRLLIMLAMTFFFFLVELVFGYVSHSMALIADSFHMMSDVMALGIAFGCLKFAERSRSSKNTFGWVRAEVLGALVNGVFLLALCFTIFIESVQRLLEPEPIKNPLFVLIVGVIGFVINLIGMAMFHGHIGHAHGSHGVEDIAKTTLLEKDGGTIDGAESRHLLQSHQDRAMAMAELEAVEESLMTHTPRQKKGAANKQGSGDQLNMRAVFLHVLSDAVGSVIVIATAFVSWQLPGYDWLKLYMDPTLSIIMVLLMVCTTVPLVRETALILLQTTPKFVNVELLQRGLLKIDGVVAVHEFHVWRLVGERIIATIHIRFRSLRHYIAAAEDIRSLFHENHIHSTTIQPEFAEMDSSANNSEAECMFACLPNNCDVQEYALVSCCTKEKRTPPKKDSGSIRRQQSQPLLESNVIVTTLATAPSASSSTVINIDGSDSNSATNQNSSEIQRDSSESHTNH